MKMRLHIVVAVFLAVLAVGFVGQKLVYRQQIEKPLQEQFAQISGVESVELTRSGSKNELLVTLDDVAELDKTYRKMLARAQGILGEQFDSIRLVDNRSPRLEDVLHASYFAIEEGIATGRFTDMAAEVAKVMTLHSISDYRLALDEKYVYLQITDHENYLFSVFPRERTTSIAGVVS